MTPTKQVNCSTCHFSDCNKGLKYKEGHCYRYPPRGMMSFPVVNAEIVCGEWKAAPKKPKAKPKAKK